MVTRISAFCLAEAYRLILAHEARTYRSQAQNIIARAQDEASYAAETLMASRWSSSAVQQFRSRMMGMLRRGAAEIAEVGWAAGGGTGTCPRDVINSYLDSQEGFLQSWWGEISTIATKYSLGFTDVATLPGGAHRARMYAKSLEMLYQLAYTTSKGKREGLPPLPGYPRDGKTRCRMNCKCRWRLARVDDDHWNAFWTMSSEPCPDCKERGKKWNPLQFAWDEESASWTMEESG